MTPVFPASGPARAETGAKRLTVGPTATLAGSRHNLTMRTHCPYCALQCGMRLERGAEGAYQAVGDTTFDVNAGDLCMKGYAAAETLAHPERLLTPLVRRDGVLCEASWEEAFDVAAAGFARIRDTRDADANAAFGSGALTNEKAYAFGKFSRLALGTANFDYNGRFCMSSAAAAANRAFGIDRGLPFPVSWLGAADVVLIAGGNPLDTMPPLDRYLALQRAHGISIVVDPRATQSAKRATFHLQAEPGSDATLAYALLHVAIAERLIDETFIATRTSGFAEVRRTAEREHPEAAERRTGVPAETIREAARALARGRRAIILTARGVEQHRNGTDAAGAYINLALALGLPGREGSGYGTITGQGNGQGGREHGQKSDQLPGYARVDDPEAIARTSGVWQCAPERVARSGLTATAILHGLGESIHGLFVMGSNPVVSAPHASAIREKLERIEHLVVCDFFLSETACYAHVVLPTLQWAEEEGTTTNVEGRVILRERVAEPPAGPHGDLAVLAALAKRLGTPALLPSDRAEDVFEELRHATRGARADYFGVTYDRLRAGERLYWPVRELHEAGTPALFGDRFATADGRARFAAVSPLSDVELPNLAFPWTLTTGRVREQYLSGTQTRRVARLRAVAPEPIVEVHPSLAARLGIGDGDLVRITSRRASIAIHARLSSDIRAETVFASFHWGDERTVNDLVGTAVDPISAMPAFKSTAVRIERVVPTA